MVNPFIDTHAHLYADEFKTDLSEVIQRAKANGIQKILLPNIDDTSVDALTQLVQTWPDLFVPMMGLHPCSVTADLAQQLSHIKKILDNGLNYCAVGEIGIDLYWDKSTLPYQQEAFLTQCNWAVERNLPVVIHSREATDILIDLLQKMPDKERPKGVFHCFGGSLEEARAIIDMDMYLGIGGVLTYKNATLKDILPHLPIDRLILETDAPYLAPVPFRGKRNESSYVLQIAQFLSDVLQKPVEVIAAHTTSNAQKLFTLID